MTIHEMMESYLERGRMMMEEACKAVFLLGYAGEDCAIRTQAIVGGQRNTLIVMREAVFEVVTFVQIVALTDTMIVSHTPKLLRELSKKTTCMMLSKFVADELDIDEKARFQKHLEICRICRKQSVRIKLFEV